MNIQNIVTKLNELANTASTWSKIGDVLAIITIILFAFLLVAFVAFMYNPDHPCIVICFLMAFALFCISLAPVGIVYRAHVNKLEHSIQKLVKMDVPILFEDNPVDVKELLDQYPDSLYLVTYKADSDHVTMQVNEKSTISALSHIRDAFIKEPKDASADNLDSTIKTKSVKATITGFTILKNKNILTLSYAGASYQIETEDTTFETKIGEKIQVNLITTTQNGQTVKILSLQ